MSDETISILEALAAGRISASEAAARLDQVDKDKTDHDDAPPEDDAPQSDAPQPDSGSEGDDEASGKSPWSEFESFADGVADRVGSFTAPFAKAARERIKGMTDKARQSAPFQPFSSEGPAEGSVVQVRVRSVGHRVRIIGDHAVATVSVTGPHVLRRTGELIEVTSDGDIGPTLEGYSLINPPRNLDDLRNVGLGKALVVRVNPSLLVDAEITAGALTMTGVRKLGDIRITAGSAHITDLTQIGSCLVQAGNAAIRGAIQSGRGTLKLESGSMSLELWDESNVTVKANANLGRISWPAKGGNVDEYVIGNGSARLEISAVMGYVSIRTEVKK